VPYPHLDNDRRTQQSREHLDHFVNREAFSVEFDSCFHFLALKGVYSDKTQLNSTDPVEQRTAKSVMFLFMTSRPTN